MLGKHAGHLCTSKGLGMAAEWGILSWHLCASHGQLRGDEGGADAAQVELGGVLPWAGLLWEVLIHWGVLS